MENKKYLNVIIVLSIIGLLTSIYMFYTHYAPPSEGSICDISSSVSCSIVNTSKYSELFNVPVSLLGGIWFVFLGLMAHAAKKNKSLFAGLLALNIIGMISVVYLIIAEILLKTLCPFCTVVHIIIVVTLVLSYILCTNTKSTRKKNIAAARPWFVTLVIVSLLPLILFNLFTAVGGEQDDHSSLAQCITNSGVNMYGSFKCGICAKTRAMFGDAFEHINEIECHPQGENSQTELCLEKGLEGTPTWILEPNGEEQKRHVGFLSIEELEEFSGCHAE